MVDQSASADLVMVTKSAVMNADTTPSMANNSAPSGSSPGLSAVNVAAAPTGVPTVNLRAFGLGVGDETTVIIKRLAGSAATDSGDRSRTIGSDDY